MRLKRRRKSNKKTGREKYGMCICKLVEVVFFEHYLADSNIFFEPTWGILHIYLKIL